MVPWGQRSIKSYMIDQAELDKQLEPAKHELAKYLKKPKVQKILKYLLNKTWVRLPELTADMTRYKKDLASGIPKKPAMSDTGMRLIMDHLVELGVLEKKREGDKKFSSLLYKVKPGILNKQEEGVCYDKGTESETGASGTVSAVI